MKTLASILALTLLAVRTLPAQQSSLDAAKAAPKITDVYHVFFAKAALGKAQELAEFLNEPDPNAPNPNHRILLRHQDGDGWDYVEIEHLGTKAIVDNNGTPMPQAKRSLIEWHNDSFASGPPWAEFAKALGIDGDASKTAGAVYLVADYRAASGHRDDMVKMLLDVPPGDTSSGNVLLQHLEGASWNNLAVVRYDSWEKFAENEKNSTTQTNKKSGGWFELRNHMVCHHDTLTDRLLP
ncbi:MAG: hypothetical protein H0X40_08480 [Chthoniobacterales bacterium]|nr:hypothetical protein [Chthoniobacterales bacterium]